MRLRIREGEIRDEMNKGSKQKEIPKRNFLVSLRLISYILRNFSHILMNKILYEYFFLYFRNSNYFLFFHFALRFSLLLIKFDSFSHKRESFCLKFSSIIMICFISKIIGCGSFLCCNLKLI